MVRVGKNDSVQFTRIVSSAVLNIYNKINK
uniref:Uncharacterized protein n=1 Tax=Nelumbo nucifera TaxID=4432 RepID=A0A822YB63_NELNU|nr:TPA_asm: hypothetical protein HUJ06_030239 [Nelumbo nucifera]